MSMKRFMYIYRCSAKPKAIVNNTKDKRQKAYFRKKGSFSPQIGQIGSESRHNGDNGKTLEESSSNTTSSDEALEGITLDAMTISFKEFGDSVFGYGIEAVVE